MFLPVMGTLMVMAGDTLLTVPAESEFIPEGTTLFMVIVLVQDGAPGVDGGGIAQVVVVMQIIAATPRLT
jgi:hypothetical protein